MARKGKFKGISLVVLDCKSGQIHSGTLVYKKPKGKYDSDIDYYLVIDNPTDYERLLFRINFSLSTQVDKAYERFIKDKKEKPSLIFYEVECSKKDFIDHNHDNNHSVILFSSVEKAQVVAKECLLPKLIKEHTYQTEQTGKKYFEMVDSLNNLETYFKTL